VNPFCTNQCWDIDERKPESFFFFIVGICGEWEGEWGSDQGEDGDLGLYNGYIYAGVPTKQIIPIGQGRHEITLRRATYVPDSTLVFYYGGHGGPLGFRTRKYSWPYQDVVKNIDESFAGDRVVLLADCCASDNLSQWMPPPHRLRHSYVCLMSIPPFGEAGSEYVMTSC
jgi:hypothetical protein